MLEQIVNWFNDAQSNKILVAILGGGIFWQLISNIRSIVDTVWYCILSCISFTVNSVNVGDYDRPLLRYKLEKVLSNSRVLWERNSELQPTSGDYNERKLMNVAYGRSYRWLWGHLVVLDRTYSTQSTKVVINVSARVFFARRSKFIRRLIREVEDCSLNDNRDSILVDMGANIVVEKPKRDIDTVYSDDNVAQRMLSDVKAFIANRETYLENSSPYKFVGLLSGTPGSGKTSTIHAIASELDMGIRFINTDREEFETIARIMTHNGEEGSKNIIVIEDIDCMSMNANDSRGDGEGVATCRSTGFDEMTGRMMPTLEFKVAPLSLSSILNLLDGIITPTGTIVFLTTNRPEKLDKALLRDGRIDARYEFGNFSAETAKRMVRDHLGIEMGNMAQSVVPSSLQRDILKVKTGSMPKDVFVEKYSQGSMADAVEKESGK